MLKHTALYSTPASDLSVNRLLSILPGKRTTPVIHKLRYIPPYEDFGELKRIQLLMHRKSREHPDTALFLDLSEWKDHLDEDFFRITLAFLYDHTDIYQPSFFLTRASERQIRQVNTALSLYFSADDQRDRCFEDADEMLLYLKERCEIAHATAEELSRAIVTSEGFPKSYLYLDRLLDELTARANGHPITRRAVQAAKASGGIAASLLAGLDCCTERIA